MSASKLDAHKVAPAPTQLEALIAAAAMPSEGGIARDLATASICNPTRSIADLAHATRAISGWYRNALGDKAESAVLEIGQAMNLGDIVKQHVAMREEWEQREAVSLSVWLTQISSRVPLTAVSNPSPMAGTVSSASLRRALLIDDSSDILVTVGAFLEAFGFAVTLASNSDAALQVLAQTPIDLLVTDHAMPGMTGKDLVIEALQRNPALRAMIITGYPDLEELRELPPSVMLLGKPFRRAELLAKVNLMFEQNGRDLQAKTVAGDVCMLRV